MGLEIISDPGTEAVREDVDRAVRSALGDKLAQGSWQIILKKLPVKGGFVVDFTNRDGIMRQWVFGPEDPVGAIIQRDLKGVV